MVNKIVERNLHNPREPDPVEAPPSGSHPQFINEGTCSNYVPLIHQVAEKVDIQLSLGTSFLGLF